MNSTERDVGGLDILTKADAVITALDDGVERSAPEIAAAVDEPVSSTYRLLANLQAAGWVESGSRRGRFRLGVYFQRIGSLLEDRLDVREAILPALRSLHDDTGATSFLCVRRGVRAVCVERVEGRNVRSLALRLGDSLPLHRGAASHALLAFLPVSERSDVLAAVEAEDPSVMSERDHEAIEAELVETRERGYSVSDGDVTVGISAIGAPVFNHRGELAAALSISDLRPLIMDDLAAIGSRVVEAASAASLALGFARAMSGGHDGR